MTEILVVAVLGLLVIAAAATYGPRLGVAAPLVLVLVGIGASLVPAVPPIEIEPEWILAGVLPPLLYSSAVSMPATNFRREFGSIGALSVGLVVLSSVVVGLFLAWAIPGLGLAWGIALGAVVSPTDAVATSIIKKTGVSSRVVAILEGESLLNDATALVLLRTAIAAVAAAFSFWGALGDFAYAVAVAVVIGFVVGRVNVWVRGRITDATINTVVSFTVPFIAAVPAELLGASGLVAAVVAGLVTGRLAPKKLSAQSRLSDRQNWNTVSLVLESAVFLVMGLELFALLGDAQDEHSGATIAVLIGVGALVLTVLVRAAYVWPLLGWLHANSKRGATMQPRLEQAKGALADDSSGSYEQFWQGRKRPPSSRDVGRFATRVVRTLADIDYFLRAPLGWREGTVVVWAGMRGAVTVAAAQTLPDDTPHRATLVLVAFVVATLSLLIQGGSIGLLLRIVKPAGEDPAVAAADRGKIHDLLRDAAASVPNPWHTPGADPRTRMAALGRAALGVGSGTGDGDGGVQASRALDGGPRDGGTQEVGAQEVRRRAELELRDEDPIPDATDSEGVPVVPSPSRKQYALSVIAAQREALLAARDDGAFDAESLENALMNLDAVQITLELQGGPFDGP